MPLRSFEERKIKLKIRCVYKKKYVYNDQLKKIIYRTRCVVENFENNNSETMKSNFDVYTDVDE